MGAGDPVYTGYHAGGLPCFWDAHPEARTMPERELLVRFGPDELAGLWVNHCCLLDRVPAERVVVVARDGSRRRLVDHPKWKAWAGEMSAGEFYSHAGADWEGA